MLVASPDLIGITIREGNRSIKKAKLCTSIWHLHTEVRKIPEPRRENPLVTPVIDGLLSSIQFSYKGFLCYESSEQMCDSFDVLHRAVQ